MYVVVNLSQRCRLVLRERSMSVACAYGESGSEELPVAG